MRKVKKGIAMATLSLKVLNREGRTICVSRGEDYVSLVCTAEYQEGDMIILESSVKNIHVQWQADDAMGPAFCFITDNVLFKIPFGEKRISYSPKAFSGNRHYLYARVAREDEVSAYRNLALNVNDQHGDTRCYPHAFANVETRGEAVFAARNAIDGVGANESHGAWPYESWGINMQDDAELTLEFGRRVDVDRIRLCTRADFPHDNWWVEAAFTFSDGSVEVVKMEKSTKPHVFELEKKGITWVKLSNLVKADDQSPFPALTQIEVYGRNA